MTPGDAKLMSERFEYWLWLCERNDWSLAEFFDHFHMGRD